MNFKVTFYIGIKNSIIYFNFNLYDKQILFLGYMI